MKAIVHVIYKQAVLDPQGKAIHKVLGHLGYGSIRSVRQGKYFEIEIDRDDRTEAREEAEEIAKKVLSNPVIEDIRIELMP